MQEENVVIPPTSWSCRCKASFRTFFLLCICCSPSLFSNSPLHSPSCKTSSNWAHSEDSDQTGQMPRLIWFFAVRTCHFLGFVMRRLISWTVWQQAKFWIFMDQSHRSLVEYAAKNAGCFFSFSAESWSCERNWNCLIDHGICVTNELPSLIRVFAVSSLVAKDPSFLHADSEDWWDWADAQANLSLRWMHSHLVGFVLSWLKCLKPYYGNYDFPRFLFQTKLPEGTRCLKLNNDSLKLHTLAGNNTPGSDQVSMDPGLSVPRSD